MPLGRDADNADFMEAVTEAVVKGLGGFEERVASSVRNGLSGVDKQIAAAVVKAIFIHHQKCGDAIMSRLADIRERLATVETAVGLKSKPIPKEENGPAQTILKKAASAVGDVVGKAATVLILALVMTVWGWINHAQTAAVATKTQETEKVAKSNEKDLKDIKTVVDMMLWGQ